MPSRVAPLRCTKKGKKNSRVVRCGGDGSKKVQVCACVCTCACADAPDACRSVPSGVGMRTWALFAEWARVSTLHGLRYVGAPESTLVERVFWATAFAGSLCSGLVVISMVWDKWDRYPVIVAFGDTVSPVWEIPFPAVTFCNDNKVKTSFLSLTPADVAGRSPEELEQSLALAALVCPLVADGKAQAGLDADVVRSFITQAAPSCADTMANYTWMGEQRSACVDFLPIITQEGLCFTFNMLPLAALLRPGVTLGVQEVGEEPAEPADWSPDGGYRHDADAWTPPRRSSGGGVFHGLEINLRQVAAEVNRRCSGPYAGFKVSLHSPAELPRPDKFFARAGPNTEFVFAVKPNVFGTDVSLQSVDPRKRMCYFAAEKRLAFFRAYSQQNCRLECFTNHTLRRCACSVFYMPALRGTPVCSAAERGCVAAARRERLLAKQVDMMFPENGVDCDCLPSCVEFEFDGETSSSPQDWTDFARETGRPDNRSVMWTRIAVFFKNDQFVSIHRNELFGFVEFISDCGGILSLFLGFSILSLAEIFYFVTLRPICGQRTPPPPPSCPGVGGGGKEEIGVWETGISRKHADVRPIAT